MMRPKIEAIVSTLWVIPGKSERTDQEIWTQFGAEKVAARISGATTITGPWMLSTPRLLLALVIMLDPVSPQHVPRHAADGTPATRTLPLAGEAGT